MSLMKEMNEINEMFNERYISTECAASSSCSLVDCGWLYAGLMRQYCV